MAARPLRGLSICSGIGGLDLGLGLALGGRYRTVGYVERDAFAAAVLVARMADARLDPAPIWDDLATFDGRAWRGAVDLVSAGFPCQPASSAGSRKGIEDHRWIWPLLAGLLRDIRPRYVFLENVRGLLSVSDGHGFGEVVGDLARLGFDAEWGVFRASDAGAPHRRERVFILGWMGDADEPGLEGRSLRGAGRTDEPAIGSRGGAVAWPPGPADADGWRRYLASGGPEPAVRRGTDGLRHRVDRLRCLGNGVVPDQAAVAFRALATRAGIKMMDNGTGAGG